MKKSTIFFMIPSVSNIFKVKSINHLYSLKVFKESLNSFSFPFVSFIIHFVIKNQLDSSPLELSATHEIIFLT